jgi:hypothetical protein|tara:strand:+ start:611 stop:712 length:102 start_codon:yes stop_codon:yes gene_type:complete
MRSAGYDDSPVVMPEVTHFLSEQYEAKAKIQEN